MQALLARTQPGGRHGAARALSSSTPTPDDKQKMSAEEWLAKNPVRPAPAPRRYAMRLVLPALTSEL